MPVRSIGPTERSSYFDAFSKRLIQSKRSDYVEIRVLSPEDGVQPETQWLPLRGITYDRRNDLLDIAVEGLDHLVYHPDEVYVDETPSGVVLSMQITQRDGTREIIEVR